MHLPIQYALTYPQRLPTGLDALDLAELGSLNFQKPDLKKFPALGLAFEAARCGGSMPAVLNAADEEAVKAFLGGQIGFSSIYKAVEKVVLRHKIVKNPSLQAILGADRWARQKAQEVLERPCR
jgi:1-deoxy-D-xylulose-5-phosphate reductoisomerase